MNSYMHTKYVQCKYILIIRDVPHVIHSNVCNMPLAYQDQPKQQNKESRFVSLLKTYHTIYTCIKTPAMHPYAPGPLIR